MRKTIFKKLEAQGLISNYNRMRKNLPPRLPKRIFVCDETLMEGTQSPAVFLTYVEKVKLAKMLDEVGASTITVGYPALSDEEKSSVRKIANEGFRQANLTALARMSISDIDACLECGIREILLCTVFNGLNLQYNVKATKGQILKTTVDSITYAKKRGAKVDFILEDGSRTPLPDILEIFEAAIRAGADRLVVSDTVGFMRPLSMRYLISHIREGLTGMSKRGIPLSVICHNDFGLATANTLAAVEEGVTHVHACVAGFGERSGCAPLEEICTALELLYDIDTGIELDKLYRLSQLAEKMFALPIQFHKPMIGENAFAYEQEAHVQAMLSNPMTYGPFPPEIIGRETLIYFGKNTKKNLVESRLSQAGIEATPAEEDEIVKRIRGAHESLDKGEAQMTFYQIKKLMKELRKGLTEEEFWKLVEQITRQKPKQVSQK